MCVQSIQSQSEKWSGVYTTSEKTLKTFCSPFREGGLEQVQRIMRGTSQTENKQTCFHIENEEMIVAVNAIYATA